MGLFVRRVLPAEAGWGVQEAGASKNILWLPKKRRLLLVPCLACPCFCKLPTAEPPSCIRDQSQHRFTEGWVMIQHTGLG